MALLLSRFSTTPLRCVVARTLVESRTLSSVAHTDPASGVGATHLRRLYELLTALSRASKLEDLYEITLTTLVDATGASCVAILLFDDDDIMRCKASRGLSSEFEKAFTGYIAWNRGTRNPEPLLISDPEQDKRFIPHREIFRREGVRAVAFIPLELESGVFGKLALYYFEPHQWAPDELELIQAIAGHAALAIHRMQSERARAANEQRLQAIVDNAAAVIFVKDVQGRYLLVNGEFEELLHVPKSEVAGRTDYDIFPPEVAERFQANDRAVLAARTSMSFEEYVPHDGGTHTWLSLKFPLEDSDGNIAGVCSISTDVTGRNQLEAARGHLAAIVENSEDAIISKDLNGIITSWNSAAERIFGYTADEVIGKPVSILAAPGHLNEMPEILSRIRKGQRIEHYETRRRRKDGEVIDISLTVSPIRDSTGNIIGASKTARDITERKHVEKELASLLFREKESRRTAELLNRVGPRLAAQLDPGRLAQEVTDIATTLIEAEFGGFLQNVMENCGELYKLYALSGMSEETFAGFTGSGLTDLFCSLRGDSMVRVEDITQNDSRETDSASHGNLPVRSYLSAPVIARSGEILGRLFFGHSKPARFSESHEAIIRGIAAQAAIAIDNARLFEQAQWAQTELKRSNDELLRVNRDLEDFAYSASHDLQEPLRTISISAELIEESLGEQLHGEDSMFLASIISAAKRMRALIQDLLAYTRATKYERGSAPHVESGRILADVLENLQGTIQETGAIVTTGELPTVSIHESGLAQIFQNLISNAIKYRSQESPRIHISAVERDGACVFSVVDNGIGIEPEFAEEIFGLFKRLHGRDEYSGSGIGLAICRRLVEQYGGRIWLERSEPGRGSVFSFSIPSGA